MKYLFILFILLLVSCGYSFNNYYSPDVIEENHHQFGYGSGVQIYPDSETTGEMFELSDNVLIAALFNTQLFYRYGLVNYFDIGADIGIMGQSLSIRKQFRTEDEIFPFLTFGFAFKFNALDSQHSSVNLSTGLSKNNFGLTAYVNKLIEKEYYSFALTYKLKQSDRRTFVPQIFVVYDPYSNYSKFTLNFALGITFDF